MSIDDRLFEKWRYASEGDSLDFKRDQYSFIGGTDGKKAELLKDILAMANSWCESDAYIVIGIEDTPQKPNALRGIFDHIDDASIQQFVNSKTYAACRFEYISYTYSDLSFGVIRIPRQIRPVYLKSRYAGLGSNVVYVRRGSSTDEASPGEIAQMGSQPIDSRKPRLHVALFDPQKGISIGNSCSSKTAEVSIAEAIPDYRKYQEVGGISMSLRMDNKDFYRDFVKYVNFKNGYSSLSFCIKNLGDLEAVNIRIEFEFTKSIDDLLTDDDEVFEPGPDIIHSIPRLASRKIDAFRIDSYPDRWVAGTHLDRLHAKREMELNGCLFVHVKDSAKVNGKIRVFYDGQSDPEEMVVEVNIEHTAKEASWNTFREHFDI